MKTIVEEEKHLCDVCKKNEAYSWTACLGCGKDICYECRKIHAKEYTHATWASGSGDGVYCNQCDERLRKDGTDKLYNAYAVIKSLRDESKGWGDAFEIRRKSAEAALNALQRRRG